MPPVLEHKLKRKVRTDIAPYNHTKKTGRPSKKDVPKSSAIQPAQKGRKNLTLHDWLTVFQWIDEHPNVNQSKIVEHFATLQEGALIFTQSTLSRKLQSRPRQVTQPEVDKSLYLWVLHMESKGETVNGPMLIAKRASFEAKLGVPTEERLSGGGWVRSFCQAYKLKERRRHGEAASVDLVAVHTERIRLQTLLKNYEERDIFNFDETGFFPFAPPDRGLATQQMSGKKTEKFRITVGVACNANGTEKLPLLFIGKSMKPRCFNGKDPNNQGFVYYNNKKAWMNKETFEDYIKKLDVMMRAKGRHILLLIDNFSGHYINYEPRNIRVEFFEPNMTPFATIREAMILLTEAWNEVTEKTIAHCWKHTLILPGTTLPNLSSQSASQTELLSASLPAIQDPMAWEIMMRFATTDMRLPEAEAELQGYLHGRYKETDWADAFQAVMAAENDSIEAVKGLEELTMKIFKKPLSQGLQDGANKGSHQLAVAKPAHPPQLQEIEKEHESCVKELKRRNKIVGQPLTLQDLLNPLEEQDIGQSQYTFEGGDDEIIAQMQHDMAVQRGEVEVMEVVDSEDEEDIPKMTLSEVLKLIESVEQQTILHAPDNSLDQNPTIAQVPDPFEADRDEGSETDGLAWVAQR
ncbi:hypothetical protein M422DRAFT_272186 [Sphaerobolus stellatus SS14]|uniref:HTH CENPB-type domain-containing protein n=1 Tax=Sphaerobolus stellatus (strain SS14) TaxID=990650 RepID=A0A0C9UN49_SPHS4|nr:hypothetical protein M422DRAFT_272186 [Sphaerobolus stellatus SS14]